MLALAIFSFVIHLLLLAGIMASFSKLGSEITQAKAINTYLYPHLPPSTVDSNISIRTSVSPPLERNDTQGNKRIQTILRQSVAIVDNDKMISIAASANNNEGQASALIALLHKAVQKQQQYPNSAQEMGRQGRVGVRFILKPNGQITQLHIVHSSQTNSLDQAALAAVSNAAPFTGVERYLSLPQEYSISVVFKLD